MKKTYINIISIFSFLIASCDCVQTVTGKVFDDKTKKPLEGVHAYKEGRSHHDTYTDTTGQFEIESISGGPFGCPGMTVILEKEGYFNYTVSIDNCGHEEVFLKRINDGKTTGAEQ